MTDHHAPTSTTPTTTPGTTPGTTPDPTETTVSTDRRRLLRHLAVGSAGAAAGALALGQTARAGDSGGAAVGGNAVELGDTNTSDTPTVIDVTPAAPVAEGPSALSVGGYVPPADSPFPAGVGGYGDDTIPNGVHGSTTSAAGLGVVAANLAAPLAEDSTDPAPAGLAVASAGGPQISFVTLDGAVAGPTTGAHAPGELYADAEGTLWFTVPVPGDADQVRFVRLAAATSAGTFHALPTAQRVYDSRELTPPTKARFGDSIDIDLTTTIEGTPSGVPAGATAAQINLTLDETEISGFARVVAKGVAFADENSSNINWYASGQILANQATTAVAADGGVSVQFAGATAGGTHLIVDVQGYYL